MAAASTPIVKGMTTGETLQKFIARKIRPDTECLERCNGMIDKFVRFLERKNGGLKTEIDDKKISVKRILKSGSICKGTAMRGKSDIDLIIFLNGFSSIRELHNDIDTILKLIKKYVEGDADWTRHVMFKEMTPFSVQFTLMTEDDDDPHDVDLLPAIDITESMSKKDIYEQMKDAEDIHPTYSASLSPFQNKFTSGVPTKAKDLIRLLKYWAKVEDVPVRSYFLELLVIAHWREDHKPQNFDLDIYFRQIMQQLAKLKTLAITFDDNYAYRLFRSNLKSPYLLDPANPYKNVAPSVGEVYKVTEKANAVLQCMDKVQQSNSKSSASPKH